jgi:hypothetical protein
MYEFLFSKKPLLNYSTGRQEGHDNSWGGFVLIFNVNHVDFDTWPCHVNQSFKYLFIFKLFIIS